jgi:hypothetical protein
MRKSKMAIALVLLAANLGLAQTALAQPSPSQAAKTATPSKPESDKLAGCPLGPMKYGYNRQCSMTGGS